jgi:hypothetical protein
VPIITDLLTSDRSQLVPYLLLQISLPAIVVNLSRAYYYRFLNQRSYSASPVYIITEFLTSDRSQLAWCQLFETSYPTIIVN